MAFFFASSAACSTSANRTCKMIYNVVNSNAFAYHVPQIAAEEDERHNKAGKGVVVHAVGDLGCVVLPVL